MAVRAAIGRGRHHDATEYLETGAYAVWRTRIFLQKLIGTGGCGWAPGLAAAGVGLLPGQPPAVALRLATVAGRSARPA